MRSLRTRLILGISIVAVLPLATAMFLMSRRIESTVRSQAEDRLTGVLALLEGQMEAEGARVAEGVRAVAGDPQLQRLHRLRPARGRGLEAYLEEKRGLLRLDLLEIVPEQVPVPGEIAPDGPAPRWRMEASADGRGLLMVARASFEETSDQPMELRGGVRIDQGFLAGLAKTSGIDLVLRDSEGVTVATTVDPELAPFIPVMEHPEQEGIRVRSHLARTFAIGRGQGPGVTITGLVSTASAEQTVSALRLTSLLLGGVGLVLAVLLAVFWSAQVSKPVEKLAAFSEQISEGRWEEPLALQSVRELQTLVTALERMRSDLSSYRDRLLASERQAAWSQMARKVAHEVKNPLTPIAVSAEDLKRSFEQGRRDFPEILDRAVRTIREEVESLKRILQEFSDFGRLPPPALRPCRLSEVMDDLGTLHGRELADGRLTLARPREDVTFTADRAQIRQALLNLVKNGLEAGGKVRVAGALRDGQVELEVTDDGPGLTAEAQERLFVPEFTTKSRGSGLGLTIVERIVTDHGGRIDVHSSPGAGTRFILQLPLQPKG